MLFKKNKFLVVKKAVSKNLCDFLHEYTLRRREVAQCLLEKKLISPFNKHFGTFNDDQVPGAYSQYGDITMDTLLARLVPLMEEKTNLKLFPTYSYVRVYKRGDILYRHADRFSCEVSTTLNLGGDPWPIYVEPSGKKGREGIRVDLNPGDMLLYSGSELEHWREEFKGRNCVQLFLHYTIKTKKPKKNYLDGRPMLGFPLFYLLERGDFKL